MRNLLITGGIILLAVAAVPVWHLLRIRIAMRTARRPGRE